MLTWQAKLVMTAGLVVVLTIAAYADPQRWRRLADPSHWRFGQHDPFRRLLFRADDSLRWLGVVTAVAVLLCLLWWID